MFKESAEPGKHRDFQGLATHGVGLLSLAQFCHHPLGDFFDERFLVIVAGI